MEREGESTALLRGHFCDFSPSLFMRPLHLSPALHTGQRWNEQAMEVFSSPLRAWSVGQRSPPPESLLELIRLRFISSPKHMFLCWLDDPAEKA